MPKYLGLNYWQMVVNQRYDFFSQSLLTVPNHLEETESYIHKNYFRDDLNWKSFVKKHCQELTENNSLDIQISNLQEIQTLCNQAEQNEPEQFESDIISKQIGECVFEVIPSSNPESLFSSECDEVELLRACDFTTEKKFEVFEEENLSKYQSEFMKDSLEDILTVDALSTFCQDIPQCKQLLERLHSESVQDPLVNTDGHVYNEKTIFSEYLKFSTNCENECNSCVNIKDKFEVFEKLQTCNLDEKEFEEIITPFEHETEDSILGSDFQKSVLESPPFFESSEIGQDIKILEQKQDGIEKGSFSPTKLKTKTFVELNNDLEENMDLSKASIESPLPSPVLLHKENDDFLKIFQILQPLPRPHSPTDKLSFLRQFEMENLENKIWRNEKYFDEILALRLQEPEIELREVSQNPQSLIMKDIKIQLKLMAQTGIGDLELQFSWDPFSVFSKLMSKLRQPEQLDYHVKKQNSNPPTCNVEEFTKYECHQSCEIIDSMMDMNILTDTEIKVSDEHVNRNTESCKEMEFSNPDVQQVKQYKITNENTSEADNERDSIKTAASLGTSSDLITMDPLQNFMSMRKIASSNKTLLTERSSCRPSKSPTCIVKPITPMTCPPPTENVVQHRIIRMKLQGPFENIYFTLEDFAKPFISVLKETGETDGEHNLASLDPDITKFLLKEREKKIKDSQLDKLTDDTYRTILIVHILCGAVGLLVHCCLESAISYLTAMQEKYSTVLDESLEDIRQKLFLNQCNFYQKSVLHPKVISVCKEVENILKISNYKEKVLIVLKRPLQTLTMTLKNALSTNNEIIPDILNLAEELIKQRFEKHNCLLASETFITKHTSLQPFILIIEYEFNEGSLTENICTEQNKNFIGYLIQDSTDKNVSSVTSTKAENQVQVTVIGSQLITCEKEVLHILETRHNVIVFERDYSKLVMFKKVYFADVIIDERHGITVHKLQDLSEDWQMEQLTKKIVCLSLHLTYCWIILYSFHSDRYVFSNGIISNIWKLQAALANISSKVNQFQCTFKVLLCTSPEDMAGMIRICCNHCIETSSIWMDDNWCRKWMKEEMTLEECCLLGFPCFSSFSAQLILTRVSLGHVLSSDFKHLPIVMPELPEKVNKHFTFLVLCDSGLKLRTIPQENENFNRQGLEHTTSGHKPDFRNQINNSVFSNKNSNFSVDKSADKYFLEKREIIPQCKANTVFENVCGSQVLQDVCVSKKKDCDMKTITCNVEGSMSLPCMEQYDHLNTECDDSFASSQEYVKPNQYVLAEMEARNLQTRKNIYCANIQNSDLDDTDFENSIVVHAQGKNKFCHSLAESEDILKKTPFSNHFVNSGKSEAKDTFNDIYNNHDGHTVSRLVSQNSKQIPNARQLYQPERCSRRNRFETPESEKTQFDVNFISSNKETEKHFGRKTGASLFLPSDSLWGQEILRSSQLLLTRFQEDSGMTRRPVLSHHFPISRKLPLQKISVGLAQPLRRNIETVKTAGPQSDQTEYRIRNTDSPPMDLEPEYQTADQHLNYADSKDRSCLFSENGLLQKCLATEDENDVTGGNHSMENTVTSKKKKLSYQPLPGKTCGQTVLTFK